MRRRARAVVRLAAAHEDGKKTALSICQCADLRIAPASRAANCLFLLPLSAQSRAVRIDAPADDHLD